MTPEEPWHETVAAAAVTAAEVRAVRFTAVTFADGYHQGQVDDFLDEIARTLENPGEPGLTPDDVDAKKFTATKFRAGYHQNEVDVFLDRVVATLRHHAVPRRPEAPRPAAPAAGSEPVPVWGSDHAAAPAWGTDPATPAWGTPESATELLAEEVGAARLRRTTGLRQGYDVAEVEGFLRQVVAALLHRGPGTASLTWREVADRTFFPTRLSAGYEPADVDALLERVARELRRRDGD